VFRLAIKQGRLKLILRERQFTLRALEGTEIASGHDMILKCLFSLNVFEGTALHDTASKEASVLVLKFVFERLRAFFTLEHCVVESVQCKSANHSWDINLFTFIALRIVLNPLADTRFAMNSLALAALFRIVNNH
jgi:hypothetical protein